jgi:DNA-binding transcriptional LysR family regulator
MELRQLECFRVLAEELHFGRAARRLFITQPPLSRQIKNLEAELGVALFERTNRRVRLTAFGEYFRGEVLRIFRELESARAQLKLMKEGAAGLVRVGYVGAVMHSILPAVLVEFRRRRPRLNTVLSELTNEGQLAALRNGQIDVGFIRAPVVAPELVVKPVYAETFSLILPSSHPLAKSRTAPLKKLAAEPFIAFGRECAPGMVDAITGICRRAGFSQRIVHTTSQINSIVRLVEAGLGWSIVPTSVRRAYAVDVRFFELAGLPERAELCVAFNPASLSPAASGFLDTVEGLDFRSRRDGSSGGRKQLPNA